jgi:hypothetical protein
LVAFAVIPGRPATFTSGPSYIEREFVTGNEMWPIDDDEITPLLMVIEASIDVS